MDYWVGPRAHRSMNLSTEVLSDLRRPMEGSLQLFSKYDSRTRSLFWSSDVIMRHMRMLFWRSRQLRVGWNKLKAVKIELDDFCESLNPLSVGMTGCLGVVGLQALQGWILSCIWVYKPYSILDPASKSSRGTGMGKKKVGDGKIVWLAGMLLSCILHFDR
jgi:hypothetical protein